VECLAGMLRVLELAIERTLYPLLLGDLNWIEREARPNRSTLRCLSCPT
jgi:hypothetical protein